MSRCYWLLICILFFAIVISLAAYVQDPKNQAHRVQRSVVDDARKTIRATTEKLTWVKRNLKYLVLMAGSFAVLFFSCAAYRRFTRDDDDDYDDDDDIRVVVLGDPHQALPPPPQDRQMNKTEKKESKTNPATKSKKKGKKTSKPIAKKDKTQRAREPSECEFDATDSDNDTRSSHLVNIRASDEEIIFERFVNQKKLFFSQVESERVPVSGCISLQQIHESDIDTNVGENVPLQYLGEVKARAERLYAGERATRAQTNGLSDVIVNDYRVKSTLDMCGQRYYPRASTNTNLPMTVTAF